ncbi:MAG: hypothetical protein OEZ32_07910 [Nitrospinota bacterium]|nr:hypothetical protein [Nitrospinota bacterium]
MFRLQGTDGVRARTASSGADDLKGLTPQQVLVEKAIITEQFMELYTYSRARQLIDTGATKEGEAMVIGWDPRDPEGLFTSAAVRGIAKAGLAPHVIGVAPTPLAALYAQAVNAAGAIVITASHNPASYNGIKIFTRRGLKLLPPDDVELTRIVMEADFEAQVKNAPEMTEAKERSGDAWELYLRYHLDPANSMANPGSLEKVTLVVDAANGAMAPVGKETYIKAGFGRVVVVNQALNCAINHKCGVAELEGVGTITRDMLGSGGRFQDHLAVAAIFELGRIGAGDNLWGAVFDGDGDRLYMIIYDPVRDNARVLTGDDTSMLMAFGFKDSNQDRYFVNTVESDLNIALAAEGMGYKTEMTAVGDKWILMKAALELVRRCGNVQAIEQVERHVAEGSLGADMLERILDDAKIDFAGIEPPLFIGGEESGHSITTGYLSDVDSTTPAYQGNGLKCLLNTSVVLSGTMKGLLMNVYEPGFKKTLYTYHVDKTKWRRGSPPWKEAERVTAQWAKRQSPPMILSEMIRPEEPDMLYIKMVEEGSHVASMFIRSSGTEDKTGVSLRGADRLSPTLVDLGEELLASLMLAIKNPQSQMGAAEMELLEKMDSQGEAPKAPVAGLDGREYGRLLDEAARQGLVTTAGPGAGITERGRWLLSSLREDK